MRMTISKKLIGGFFGLSMLVLLAGMVGIFVLNKVTLLADTIAKEKAPTRYVVMKAALEVDILQKNMIEYSYSTFNLEEISSKITAGMAEFDMWIAMLLHGTASNEFLNSPSQALFQNKKLELVIPRCSPEMLPIVQGIFDENSRLKAKAAELIASKKLLNSYGVKIGTELLDLPIFLNLAQLDSLDWIRQLKDAVNIETNFKANTDPTKGLIGEWFESYRIANGEFMEKFVEFKEEYVKMLAMADKINSMPAFKDKTRILNRSIGITVKIEAYFRDLQALAGTMYKALQADNKLKQTELETSVKSINAQLSSLVSIADKEMQIAVDQAESAKKSGVTMLMVLTIIAVIAAVVLGALVSRAMSSRILSVAESTKNIAGGDLRKDLAITSNDEIGDLAHDTNIMIANLRQMIGKILTFASKLTASSVDLTGVSKDFDKDSTDLSAKSSEASEATATMNASMQEISNLANDSNQRVQSVAIATEEMSSTIAEIARNTEQAREITSKAVTTVENTTAKMNELSNAANEIGKVAEVIGNIAKQTNLLSLNATIEAARAGDAGKGFAVVANEVKELASQTNKATGDIRSMIEAIQQSSIMTISEISKISNIINEINSIVVVIAGAVEEQAVTTKQITEDINSVSEGFEAMTIHVNSATEISGTVAADINDVSITSLSVGQGSSYIHERSIELGKLADELNQLVGQFKL